MPLVKSMPNYTRKMSWYSVIMSPRSKGGIGALGGLPRIARTQMDMWTFAPEKNTLNTERRRFSKILVRSNSIANTGM
jgi:hypothetical protein